MRTEVEEQVDSNFNSFKLSYGGIVCSSLDTIQMSLSTVVYGLQFVGNREDPRVGIRENLFGYLFLNKRKY